MRYQLRYIRVRVEVLSGIAGGFVVREETLACPPENTKSARTAELVRQ